MKFSAHEKKDLAKAWFVLSLAFAIAIGGIGLDSNFLILLVITGFTAGIGFLLHELAHKFFAQRYGAWAEFRAFDKMLMIALLVSVFGFIFAAPGAVFIRGLVSRRQNGVISLAGPVTNFALATAFILLNMFTPLGLVTQYGAQINAWLGVFNLLPFFGLDGEKVLHWDKRIYGGALLVGIALVFASQL